MINFSWHDNSLLVSPSLPYSMTYEYFYSLPRVVAIDYFGQSMMLLTTCESQEDKEKFLRAFQSAYVLALAILEGACP